VLDRFVTEQEEILAAIKEDDDIAAGRVLDHEEVVARFERRITQKSS